MTQPVQTQPVMSTPTPKLNHRYCCRCLQDRDTKGGRNNGGMFTCAECRGALEGKQP